jgi:hypothetical protein
VDHALRTYAVGYVHLRTFQFIKLSSGKSRFDYLGIDNEGSLPSAGLRKVIRSNVTIIIITIFFRDLQQLSSVVHFQLIHFDFHDKMVLTFMSEGIVLELFTPFPRPQKEYLSLYNTVCVDSIVECYLFAVNSFS